MPAQWRPTIVALPVPGFYSGEGISLIGFEPADETFTDYVVFSTPDSGAFDVYVNGSYLTTQAAGEDYRLSAQIVYDNFSVVDAISIGFVYPSTLVSSDLEGSFRGLEIRSGVIETPSGNGDVVSITPVVGDSAPTFFDNFLETLMADHLNWLSYLDVLEGFYPSLESNLANTKQKVLDAVDELAIHNNNIEPFRNISGITVDDAIISDVLRDELQTDIANSIDDQVNAYNENDGLKDRIDDAFDAVVAFIEKTSNASRTYNNPLVRNSLETLNVSTAKPELQAYKANLSAETDIEFVEGVLKGQAVQLLNSTDTALDTFITGIQNLLNSADSTSIIAKIEQLRAAEVE